MHRGERMSPSISGETTSFASWMLLPLHPPVLTSGYEKVGAQFSAEQQMGAGEAGGAMSIAGTSQQHEHWAGRMTWKKPMGHPVPTTKGAPGGGEPRLLQK